MTVFRAGSVSWLLEQVCERIVTHLCILTVRSSLTDPPYCDEGRWTQFIKKIYFFKYERPHGQQSCCVWSVVYLPPFRHSWMCPDSAAAAAAAATAAAYLMRPAAADTPLSPAATSPCGPRGNRRPSTHHHHPALTHTGALTCSLFIYFYTANY